MPEQDSSSCGAYRFRPSILVRGLSWAAQTLTYTAVYFLGAGSPRNAVLCFVAFLLLEMSSFLLFRREVERFQCQAIEKEMGKYDRKKHIDSLYGR